MELVTAWIKSPPQVGGLDHLAVQALCINIYGRFGKVHGRTQVM